MKDPMQRHFRYVCTMPPGEDAGLSEAEKDLKRVIRVIVNDYNGDTLAFFNSIQSDVSPSLEEDNQTKRSKEILQKLDTW